MVDKVNQGTDTLTDQQRYILSLSKPDQKKYNMLVKKNLKTRSELLQLGHKLDSMIQQKRSKELNSIYLEMEESQEVKDLNDQLKDQQLYINDLNAEIKNLKQEYNELTKNRLTIEKENELRYLNGSIADLLKKKKGLEKIRKQQEESFIDDSSKIENLKEEIENLKVEKNNMREELKFLKDDVDLSQKEVYTAHKELVNLKEKLHKFKRIGERKLKNSIIPKNKEIFMNDSILITQEDIDNLENELEELQQEKDEIEGTKELDQAKFENEIEEMLKIENQLKFELEANDRVNFLN